MKKTTLLASAITLALLTGCGTKDATEHYSEALSYIDKQQYNAAVIELKSAIQQAPENADYRLLLARIYARTGDFVSAEKEFERALRNGMAAELLAIEYVQASYLVENYSQVLSLFDGNDSLTEQTQAYLRFYQALAEIELGDPDNAISIFDQLLNSSAPDLRLYAESALHINARNLPDALSNIRQIDSSSLIYKEALLLTAQLQLGTEQTEQALENLYQYLAQVPNAFRIRLQVAQVQLQQKNAAKADEQLTILLKVVPEHGLTNYLKAAIEFDKANFNLAKEHIDKAMMARFNNLQSRVLAGLTHYKLGLETQALAHLSAVSTQLAAIPQAQRLYTYLRLKAGEITDAAAALKASELVESDISLVAGTAQELIRQGDTRLAAEIISRYESSALPQDSKTLSILGNLRMALPEQQEEAIRNLEQALILDPSQHNTRLALVGSYIRQKQYDKASTLADEWLTDDKTRNAGYNLKALVHLLKQEPEPAATALKNALQADDKSPFSYYLLAALAAENQQQAESDRYLEQTIAIKADYLPALVAYFRSQSQQNEADKALNLIETAHKTSPENGLVTMLLAQVYNQQQRFAEVISLLSPLADNTRQHSANFYALLSNAYVQSGQHNAAIPLAERWYKNDERNLQAGLAYAKLLAASKQLNESLSILNKLLNLSPRNSTLLYTKVAVLSVLPDYQAALQTFMQLPAELRASADMLYQQGQIQAQLDMNIPALNSMQASYEIQPADRTAIAIGSLLSKDVSFRKAAEFLQQHEETHTPSVEFMTFYANMVLHADARRAQQIYASLLAKDNNNITYLNNYAWVLLEDNKPDQAMPYIEQALAIAPRHPDILDTHGKALLQLNKIEQALSAFEQSLAERPKHISVTLNYAEALIAANRLDEAKVLLNDITPRERDNQAHKTRLLNLVQR